MLGLRRHGVVELALAVFLGWAIVLVAVSLLATVEVMPGVAEVLAIAVTVVVGSVLARRVTPTIEERRGRSGVHPLLRLVGLAGVVVLALSLASALVIAWRSGADSTWDTWAFWLPKAKAIYYFHGLSTGVGGFTSFPHASYPPGIPLMDSAAFSFMGGVHPRTAAAAAVRAEHRVPRCSGGAATPPRCAVDAVPAACDALTRTAVLEPDCRDRA